MSEKSSAAIGPSKIAMTKMLAEIEATRKHATRRWQLALLLPLVVGAVLIGLTTREVRKNLNERNQLVFEKSTLEADIVELKATREKLTTENNEKALTIQRIENVVQESEEKGLEARSLEKIRNIIGPTWHVEKFTPRVFIRTYGEDQQTSVAQVAQSLKSAGFIIAKVERSSEKVNANEVRFFRQEDRETGQRVADILSRQGLKDATLVLDKKEAPAGQIEVWLTTTTLRPTPERDGNRIVLSQRDDVTIVRIHSPLTKENASDFRSLLTRLRQQGRRKFLIDISKIDGDGLRALASEHTATKRAGGQMEVLYPAEGSDLMATKLRTIFTLHRNEGEAMRSLK